MIPADLPGSTREEMRRLAARAFDVLGGEGFARVDFFLERGTQRILVSEINSLPGFTPISMFPKMWEASGLGSELLDRLVAGAFPRPARGRWAQRAPTRIPARPISPSESRAASASGRDGVRPELHALRPPKSSIHGDG